MKKNLGYFILAATILAGCSNSENEVEAQQPKGLTSEQQDMINEYELAIDESNEQAVIFKYYSNFMKTNDYTKRTDKLIKLYNIAIQNSFKESNDKFFINEKWVDYSIIDDKNLKEIITYRERELSKIKETMVLAIEKKDYERAEETFSGYIKDDSTQALREYANSLNNIDLGYTPSFINVSPYYDGVMANEILANASSINGSLDQWVETYNRLRYISGGEKIEKIELKNPTIGMTIEETLNSSWGKPESINKTTTSDSVREQWVYPNFNYLYFKDGILISFQESY